MKNTLFSSFKDLYHEVSKITDKLENHRRYKAHTPASENGEKENLEEHIMLVNQYALLMIEQHRLEPIIDSIILELVRNCKHQIETGNWIKKLFLSAVVFHDYGKINPNFQLEKMGELTFAPFDHSIKVSSGHSKLSAYLFLNELSHQLKTVDQFLEKERYLIIFVGCVFTVSILRHHSSTLFSEFNFTKEELDSLRRFLHTFGFDQSWDDIFFNESVNVLREDIYSWQLIGNPFLIFSLIKLNFSLLTSADFYATNQYINNMPITDFGLINQDFRETLLEKFWQYQYNRKTLDNWNNLKNTDFRNLEKRDGKNLNILRSKLMIEALENLRDNSSKNLFYLEAPTGSGKTNVSLALALEFLKLDTSLNKIFYVFPFTTLIVQTFDTLKHLLELSDGELIQLHSKSGFHSRQYANPEHEGEYGTERLNYLDNLFIHYPVTMLTHIKFFNILKGNDKETNYLFHRLANSVVILDEIQSYNPKHWDKMAWILSEFARLFNMKFILMSATLPKIDKADKSIDIPFQCLISDKDLYFRNPNFGQRIEFNFELLTSEGFSKNNEKSDILLSLAHFVNDVSLKYSLDNDGKVKTIVEFITKKTANAFYNIARDLFEEFEIFLLSGDILDTRRNQIIKSLKSKEFDKVLLITTQVVEAGVDIDMDLGFKDKSILDSDEQLAGRVNRNASKTGCKVYIFDLDNEYHIYKNDDRLKITRDKIKPDIYEEILTIKDFDRLYNLVIDNIDRRNINEYDGGNIQRYKDAFIKLDFNAIREHFRLIENEDTVSVFVPLSIPIDHLDKETVEVARSFEVSVEDVIDGAEVFQRYVNIITNKEQDLIRKQVDSKKIYGLLSKFMFSTYRNAAKDLLSYSDIDSEQNFTERFGIIYLSNWKDYKGDQVYSYESGINYEFIKNDFFL